MDTTVIALVGFLTISLVFSFLCSILEAVLLSTPPSYVATLKGTAGRRLRKLKQDIDKPLSAILTLNTFAHTIGAAGVGASAQLIWGEASLTLVSGIVTIIILIASEIIPKTIGAVYWERLAGVVSLLCQWLTWILYPIVMACQIITRMLRKGETKSILSRGEVSQVVKFGYLDGFIREHEKDIIENLMIKERLLTSEIMTPKQRLVSLDESLKISVITPHSAAWHLSRIPTFSDNPNRITGYVLKDEVLGSQLLGHRHKELSGFKRPILFVNHNMELKDLYDELVSSDEHIAIVMEGDIVVGVVTMEDVLEEVLGQEIVDESDLARGVID